MTYEGDPAVLPPSFWCLLLLGGEDDADTVVGRFWLVGIEDAKGGTTGSAYLRAPVEPLAIPEEAARRVTFCWSLMVLWLPW